MRAPFPLLLASIVLVGCASGGGSGDSDVSRDRNRISAEELALQPSGSAWDAISRLRPVWLRSRGRSLGEESLPRVFVDGRDFGPLEALHGLAIEDISAIRFIPARDATTRFGTGYPGGIIDVMMKSP